jgi:hypothetical protein
MKFNKPQNLDGAKLYQELSNAGVSIDPERGNMTIESDGSLFLKIDLADEAKAAKVIANHNGAIIAPEPTIEDKLASVGLNLTDLKTALGI